MGYYDDDNARALYSSAAQARSNAANLRAKAAQQRGAMFGNIGKTYAVEQEKQRLLDRQNKMDTIAQKERKYIQDKRDEETAYYKAMTGTRDMTVDQNAALRSEMADATDQSVMSKSMYDVLGGDKPVDYAANKAEIDAYNRKMQEVGRVYNEPERQATMSERMKSLRPDMADNSYFTKQMFQQGISDDVAKAKMKADINKSILALNLKQATHTGKSTTSGSNKPVTDSTLNTMLGIQTTGKHAKMPTKGQKAIKIAIAKAGLRDSEASQVVNSDIYSRAVKTGYFDFKLDKDEKIPKDSELSTLINEIKSARTDGGTSINNIFDTERKILRKQLADIDKGKEIDSSLDELTRARGVQAKKPVEPKTTQTTQTFTSPTNGKKITDSGGLLGKTVTPTTPKDAIEILESMPSVFSTSEDKKTYNKNMNSLQSIFSALGYSEQVTMLNKIKAEYPEGYISDASTNLFGKSPIQDFIKHMEKSILSSNAEEKATNELATEAREEYIRNNPTEANEYDNIGLELKSIDDRMNKLLNVPHIANMPAPQLKNWKASFDKKRAPLLKRQKELDKKIKSGSIKYERPAVENFTSKKYTDMKKSIQAAELAKQNAKFGDVVGFASVPGTLGLANVGYKFGRTLMKPDRFAKVMGNITTSKAARMARAEAMKKPIIRKVFTEKTAKEWTKAEAYQIKKEAAEFGMSVSQFKKYLGY